MSRRFRICMAKGGRESARPSYGRPKLTLNSRGEKIPKTVCRKTLRPQFSYFSLEIESAVFWYIRNIADSISRLKSENCGRKVLGNTYLFLLATRISPASPNFGQAKHGQNGPAATDCQQCIFYPICGHHFTHRTHTNISFRFRPGGRRLKNFHFSRNSIAARVFFLPACCGLNFDATDLPHSSFEPLYPKLFRGTPEVDLVSTVWPPDLPKVRWCRYLSPRNGCF